MTEQSSIRIYQDNDSFFTISEISRYEFELIDSSLKSALDQTSIILTLSDELLLKAIEGSEKLNEKFQFQSSGLLEREVSEVRKFLSIKVEYLESLCDYFGELGPFDSIDSLTPKELECIRGAVFLALIEALFVKSVSPKMIEKVGDKIANLTGDHRIQDYFQDRYLQENTLPEGKTKILKLLIQKLHFI